MRVISGSLRGRQFKSPRGNRSHPMSEKMRGALFNALGDLSGLTVLDAYGGSGALAYEAISRGASSVITVEKSVMAYRTVQRNLVELDLGEVIKATRANVSTWSDNKADLQFDVVLADPPYNDIRPDILEKLTRHVKPSGIFVVSWPGSEEPPEFSGLKLLKVLEYGDSKLVFFRTF